MTTETQVATTAETQNTAADTTNNLEVVDQGATDDAGQTPDSTAPAKTPEQIEVERLRRALTKRDRTQGSMHRELEQLRAQLAERQPAQPQTEDTPDTKPEDIRKVVEREAMTLAERIAEQREFAAKCNSVAAAGKEKFKDFPQALTALIEEAGPLVTPQGVSTVLGDLILDSDAPAALIHHLGTHPELAAELDGLTAGRMARKLARIEEQMSAKPKTSQAPRPLEPVRGSGGSKDPSDMSTAEFRAWRKAQIAQRR